MELQAASPVLLGLLGSLVAGLGTGIGALPILFAPRTLSQRAYTLMLGFAAGVMLGATAFSLIVPGLEAAGERVGAGLPAGALVAAGMLLGGLALSGLHRFVPHEHFVKGLEDGTALPVERVSRLWLFVLAIALHNLPEGLAVGVGFGGAEPLRGVSLAVGIGLQNLPEGFAVAAALGSLGYARQTSFGVALGTGFIEPLGGLIGVLAVTLAAPLLPWALAFAAGAMLYVVSGEIIPETHREGSETRATFAVLAGFALMMVLDVSLV